MREVRFGYGRGEQTVAIQEKNHLATLMPAEIKVSQSEGELIGAALATPIGTERLKTMAKGKKRIAIVISDVTRPCPSAKILPAVVRELEDAGIADDDILIVSALGSHRRQTEAEHRRLVGDDIYDRFTVVDSDVNDCVSVGVSSRGTPFDLYRPVVEADLRIGIGNIDYHYFAGYSGGCKAIVPGVCTRATIEKNHAMMLLDDACVAKADGNPVREDLEESLRFISLDFIVNVILDEHKHIVGAVAGDAIEAHRVGCGLLDRLYLHPIAELADIVITSPGGLPKDINVYQTQKALDNAKWAVKEGGIIIVVGECAEGYGENTFAAWLNDATCPEDLIERVAREFRLGGHKAAAIAKVEEKAAVFLVSSLPKEMTDRLYMRGFTDLQAAYDAALAIVGEHATVYCMPIGGTTLPRRS